MPQWLTRHKWLLIVGAVAIGLLIFAACGDDDDDEDGVTPVDGEPTAEIVQPTLPLKIGHVNSFTGDLGDFGPAHDDAAKLAIAEINAAGGVGGQPVEFVGVAVWDERGDTVRHLERFDVPYPNVVDELGMAAVSYGAPGVPEKFFVDREGRIVRKLIGPTSTAQLTSIIDELLAL